MKKLKYFIAFIIGVTVFSAYASEDDALMIIRFNKLQHTYYQPMLEKVVKKAREVKSGVFFDIVSISPQKEGEDFKNKLIVHTNNIAGTINNLGIPPKKIRITYRSNSKVSTNEVHIFAR